MRKIKTCLRYPGGKFYGFKKIEPFIEVDHDEYREPFVGGGSVFLGKELAKKVNWINDKDEDLINFYKVIQNKNNCDKMLHLLKYEIASRERHAEVLKLKPKNNIEKAFRYFYLNRTSFSGIMNKPRWGYKIGSSTIPEKWQSIIIPVAEKLKSTIISCIDYKELILKPSKNKVLLYLDPPYFEASRAIYKYEFSKDDHIELMKLLKKTKFNFILSYNNSEKLKKIYSWANIYEFDWTYFMSEGRRQNGKELIITNFKV